jgi:undecaprenyl-diphosphatase
MRSLKEKNKLAVGVSLLAVFLLLVTSLDRQYMMWLREFKTGNPSLRALLDTVYPLISYASNGVSFIALIGLFFILSIFYNKRLRETGTALCIGYVVTGLAVQILKHLIGRARPKLTDSFIMIGPSWKSGYDSFPSGHTAGAFCIAYILAQYYPKYRILFFLCAVLFGAGRLKIPSHFLSDVFAGAIFGLFTGKLTFHYFTSFMERKINPDAFH